MLGEGCAIIADICPSYIYFLQPLGLSASGEDKFTNIHNWHLKIGMVMFTFSQIMKSLASKHD